MAYKGSGKKAQIQSAGGRRSAPRIEIGGPGSVAKNIQNIGSPKKSKSQSGSSGNSRKVHDTKGKNTQGRRRGWF